LKNRELIYTAIQLMEENLKSDMTVLSLCRHFGISIYYFSRLFKGITGYTPKSYMLQRKVSEAGKELAGTDKKIIHLAFDYGFGTPESFSRAFHKVTGLNPSQVRKIGKWEEKNFLRPLTREYLEKARTLSGEEPRLVILDEFHLVGIPFYFDLALKKDLSKPWSDLVSNASLVKTRVTPERYYQLQYWFDNQDEGTYFFFIALQTTGLHSIPIQFTGKTIPKQTYLHFRHHGRANRVGETYRYIYESYLPDSEYTLPHLFNFEFYGDDCKGPDRDDSISEIYIPVTLPPA